MSQAKRRIEARFLTRDAAERYRNRFLNGKRVRTHEREARALSSALEKIGPLGVIADVASGAGRFAPVWSGHGGMLLQMDIAWPMLEVSRGSFPLESMRGVYAQGDARHLPLGDGCADLVFCHRLLNHLPSATERAGVIAELARVSRRYVVLSSLSIPLPLRLVRDAFRRVRALLTRRPSADRYIGHAEIIRDAESHGLRLTDHVPIRTFPAKAQFLLFAKPAT